MPRQYQPPTYQRRKVGASTYARTKYLGKWVSLGVADTPESVKKFRAIEAQWDAYQAGQVTDRPAAGALTVADLVARFFRDHALNHYRHPDGTPTSEIREYRASVAPLLRLYGPEPATSFSPLKLKAVRTALITGSWLTKEEQAQRIKGGRETTCCRAVADRRMFRLVRLWGWAVGEELVPESVVSALREVKGLGKGRTNARETEEIPPAPEQDVRDVLPLLAEPFATMALLQLAAGMRPAEVCSIRKDQVDQLGLVVDGVRVWVIRPSTHKTAHHGIKRQIALGPAAQVLLRPWLDVCKGEWVFAAGCKARKVGHVSTSGYQHALLDACRQAGLKETFAPNQLRKAAATAVEDKVDLDTARATLGHTKSEVTKRFYAKGDLKKAAGAARKLG